MHEIRFALRMWRQNPGFAFAAIGTLALGLGMATALFSAVDRMLFRSLPYPEADRIVSVGLMAPLDSNEFLLGGDYATLWRATPEPFEETTTFTAGVTPCDLTEAQPERLGCLSVESNLLDLLRVPVVLGRSFTRDDDKPGATRVALITHGVWMRRFGGRQDVAGRTLTLDGKVVPVIGVLPRGFELPLLNEADVLLPQQLDPRPGPASFLRGFGRLKPGVTPARAHLALQPLFQQMLNNVPAAFRKEVTLRVRPLRDRQAGDGKRSAWFLLGAAGVLLLIACSNVTNLLLARMAARERELAIRAALGAGRGRLARLILAESLGLALVGGVLGLLLAQVLLQILVALAPGGIPRLGQAAIDARVFAAAIGFAALSAVLVALWPMLLAPRADSLHSRRGGGSIRPRARFAFAATQVALTFALLGASALLLRSLANLQQTPLGIETTRVVTLSVTLGASRYATPEHRVSFFERLLEGSQQFPGTTAAALTDSLPPAGGARGMIFSRIQVEGRPLPSEGTGGMVTWRSVTPAYFRALQVPLVRGRFFTGADRAAPEPAIVLSESLARRLFPNEDPLGRRLKPGAGDQPWHVVTGIAKDVRNAGLAAAAAPEYYVCRQAKPRDAHRQSFLVLRTQAGEAAIAQLLREEMTRLDPELPFRIETMEQRVGRLTAGARFTAWLVSLFAVLALVLAATGLSGVAAYLVAQRTHEIGIRMALGATAGGVARSILAETGRWALAGAAFGAVLAFATNRLLGSFLHGVTASDPVAWAAAVAALTAALFAAVLRPALRAARIDPMAALRE